MRSSLIFPLPQFPRLDKKKIKMLKLAFAALVASVAAKDKCVEPGICVPPKAAHSVVLPMAPRQQWGNSGGYCGSASVQMNSLLFGNYFSQDQVRKANDHGEGHGSKADGFEVLPTNIEQSMTNLALTFESFDVMNTTKPQAPAYKKFLKQHLVQGHPVVWFVMCRGDGDQIPYPGSNPNDGRFSHIEPVWGIYTNLSLDDPTVSENDWLVHGSDWDQNGYHREFSTLVDTAKMEGNCANAGTHPGTNEAYPCIYDEVDYGYAITGNQDPKNRTVPAVLIVDNHSEPNINEGRSPAVVHGVLNATVVAGQSYTIYRYDGKENVPTDSNFEAGKYAVKQPFTATSSMYSFQVCFEGDDVYENDIVAVFLYSMLSIYAYVEILQLRNQTLNTPTGPHDLPLQRGHLLPCGEGQLQVLNVIQSSLPHTPLQRQTSPALPSSLVFCLCFYLPTQVFWVAFSCAISV